MTSRGTETESSNRVLSHGHAQFTEDTVFHSFRVQGEDIALWHHPDVFPPSSFGLKFADRIALEKLGADDVLAGTAVTPLQAGIATARR